MLYFELVASCLLQLGLLVAFYFAFGTRMIVSLLRSFSFAFFCLLLDNKKCIP